MKYSSRTLPAIPLPVAALVVGLLAYGVLIPWLGFYWDDWAKIAVARLHGLGGYWAYYAEDRPLSSWTHIVFTTLLGTAPLGWHIFQLGLKLAATCAAYGVLSLLMPASRRTAAAAALLFLVYPVFTAHPAAVTFHQQWLQYALILLSFALTVFAAVCARTARQDRAWTLAALLCMPLQLSVTEYFASLELLRPLLIWLALGQRGEVPGRARLRAAAARSAPYLVLLALYGIWRMFLRPFSGRDPYGLVVLERLAADPLGTLPVLLRGWTADVAHTLVSVWGPLLVVGRLDKLAPFQILAFGLGAAAGVCVFVSLIRLDPAQSAARTAPPRGSRGAWLVGAAAFALGMLPGWLTGHSVMEDFHADRYALPALFGAALLWAAAIDWLTPARVQRALLAALLVGLSAGQQLRVGNEYRWLWETEGRFFWQLYWRAPHLEAGTALLTYQEVFPNQGLFSSSAALNLLYPQPAEGSPEARPGLLPYWWYTLSPRYDINKLEDPIELTMYTQFRSLVFRGSTPATLLVHYDPSHGNCLWVIGEGDEYEPGLPPLVKAMRSISNLDQIRPAPRENWRPPQELFGPEPAHDWCYLYQKADLARQTGDWPRAAELGDQALALGYSPSDSRSNAPREWLPFIEAFARVGRWPEAAALTAGAAGRGKEFHAPLARLWRELAGLPATGAGQQEAVQTVRALLEQAP